MRAAQKVQTCEIQHNGYQTAGWGLGEGKNSETAE